MNEYVRTVTYVIHADTLDEAEDIWADDGPELADTGTIDTDTSNFAVKPLDSPAIRNVRTADWDECA